MRGAREHNLKNIDVAFPRDRLVVITGLSGSRQVSLAFDTIYAEGQRRYVESLSAYARQFLGQMEKPDVDQIDGLSPRSPSTRRAPRATRGRRSARSPRSTTTCASCSPASATRTARTAAARSSARREPDRRPGPRAAGGTRLLVLGPLIKDRKTEGDRVFEGARKQGFVRVRVDGEQYDLGGADARQVQAPHDRGRRRPVRRPPRGGTRGLGAGRAGRPIDPETGGVPDRTRRGSPTRSRPRCASARASWSWHPRRATTSGHVRGAALLRALQLPVRRHDDRRPRAAVVLVQLAPRRVPDLHRPRHAARDRPGAVLPDKTKSIKAGALVPWNKMPTEITGR